MAFRSLPRAQFSTLQQGIFPVYFGMQTALPILLAITYPGEKTVLRRTDSSLAGVLAPENRYTVLAPLALIFSMGLANATIVGPATTRVMRQRKHQG